MKKILFLSLLLLIAYNLKSQTKEETERWILHKISENFNTWDNSKLALRWLEDNVYFQYQIIDQYFVILKEIKKKDTPSKIVFNVINLKDIIDIKLECKIEKGGWPLKEYYAQVTLNFTYGDNCLINQDFAFIRDSLITKEYIERKVEVRNVRFYSYQRMYFGQDPSVKELCPKLQKAFLHLAELNGARLVKDIF